MPQMSPMLWLMLMNFSLMTLMLVMVMIYFYWYPFNMLNYSTKMKKLNMKFNFKW